MCWKPPFKILGSSDSVFSQKRLIFIFLRVIISPEKNPRKPMSILREEIRDFKLLKHIKLLVTDSTDIHATYTCKPAPEMPAGAWKRTRSKMDEKWEMRQKRTRHPFLKNGVFRIIFDVVSLPIFDSIFQKNERKNEIKNEWKKVTVNDTIVQN